MVHVFGKPTNFMRFSSNKRLISNFIPKCYAGQSLPKYGVIVG